MSNREIIVAFGDTVLDVQHLAKREDAEKIFKEVTGGHEEERGALTYAIRTSETVVALAKKKAYDFAYARLFMISALAHAFFIVAAFITPASASLYGAELRERSLTWRFEREPEPEKKTSAAKAPGKEGRIGDPKARLPNAAPSKHRRSGPQLARDSGLLAMLRNSGGEVAAIFNRGGFGGGLNERMGGLNGNLLADMGGAGGLSTRGLGPGGGGNTVGIGAFGLRDRGGGSPDGAGGGPLGPHREVIVTRDIVCAGEGCFGLTREEIARVIRRNIPRFRYCYEKQLNANPNLAGKVALSFTIGPTGAVIGTSIRETTMGEDKVDQCVSRVMSSLVFPKPKGGGVVIVSYPFVFQSSG